MVIRVIATTAGFVLVLSVNSAITIKLERFRKRHIYGKRRVFYLLLIYSWVQVQGTPVQGTFGLKRRQLYTLD